MKQELNDLLAARAARIEQIAKLDLDLAYAKSKLKSIEEQLIPDLLMERGLMSCELEDGRTVTVGMHYYASIPKDRRDEALDWLLDNGHATLIKKEVTLKFDRTEADIERARFAQALLRDNGFSFSLDETVHPQTLRAFVSREIESGGKVPYDLLGVSVVNKAVVK